MLAQRVVLPTLQLWPNGDLLNNDDKSEASAGDAEQEGGWRLSYEGHGPDRESQDDHPIPQHAPHGPPQGTGSGRQKEREAYSQGRGQSWPSLETASQSTEWCSSAHFLVLGSTAS